MSHRPRREQGHSLVPPPAQQGSPTPRSRQGRPGANRAIRRRAAAHGRRLARAGAIAGASALLTFGTATAAGACAAGQLQWAGKVSGTGWDGVEGKISVDHESMPTINQPTGTGHILNSLTMSESPGDCPNPPYGPTRRCFIAAGNQLGLVGGNCHNTAVVEAYMEENDVNQYDCADFSPGQISLAQQDFYTVFYTGTCNGDGYGLVNAYINNGTSLDLIGQAWLPACALSQVYANTEFLESATSSCPTLTKYEEFGYGTNELYESPNGKTWDLWTQSEEYYTTSTGPNPLHMTPTPPTSADRFKTWG